MELSRSQSRVLRGRAHLQSRAHIFFEFLRNVETVVSTVLLCFSSIVFYFCSSIYFSNFSFCFSFFEFRAPLGLPPPSPPYPPKAFHANLFQRKTLKKNMGVWAKLGNFALGILNGRCLIFQVFPLKNNKRIPMIHCVLR